MTHETRTIAEVEFTLVGDQALYWAAETKSYWACDASDLDDLEDAIDAGEKDAYSNWCNSTEAREMGDDYEAAIAKLEREEVQS